MEQIRKEPYPLAPLYCWGDVDVLKDDELTELYTLLTENYVEDDENMFRFNYSREFLRWYFYRNKLFKLKYFCFSFFDFHLVQGRAPLIRLYYKKKFYMKIDSLTIKNVSFQFQAPFSLKGSIGTELVQGLALRNSIEERQQAGGVYFGRSSAHSRLRQERAHGGDQLPLHS